MLEEPLLRERSDTIAVVTARWYILGVFSLGSFIQCLMWITFSPISELAQAYFSVSANTVVLLLNCGPIAFVPAMPVSVWVAGHWGLRKIVLLNAGLLVVAAALRVVVCAFPEVFVEGHGGSKAAGLTLVFAAHALVGVGGPLVMAMPSQLSQTWFADGERTTATAIGSLANNFGAAAGFLLGPFVVHTNHPEQVPNLIYIHAGLALLLLVLVLAYFPTHPPFPPSLAAAEALARRGDGTKSATATLKLFFSDMRGAVRHRQLLLLSVCGGAVPGVFNCWSGIISDIVRPLGYTDTDAGWFGFSSTIAAIVGGIVVGHVADKYFKRQFKALLVALLVVDVVFFVWWTVSLPSSAWDKGLLPHSKLSLLVAITGGGLFIGSTMPVFLEMAVEVTYPLPEAASAGIITFLNNLGALVFLCIPTSLNKSMNLVMTASSVLSLLVMCTVKEEYKRTDFEVRDLDD